MTTMWLGTAESARTGLFRLSPVNFAPWRDPSCIEHVPSQRVRADTTFCTSTPTIRGIHVLVIEYRQSGGNRCPRAPHPPPFPSPDFLRGFGLVRRRHR